MSNLKETKKIKNTDTDPSIEDLTLNRNRLVSERACATLVGVSYETMKRSIRWQGRIPFYRVNKRISYKVGDILDYLEKCKVPAKA